jgi:hypothetical protein
MNTHTDTYPTTPPTIVATAPHHRRRTTFVALSVVTLLAIGAVVAVAQLANDGSGSVVHPSTAAALSPIPVNACGPEITHLLATVAALPPTVVTSLSPDLAHIVDASVSYNHTPQNFPAPTTADIGRVLAQLKLADRNAIMAALPTDQQPAVAAAEAQTADAFWASGAITPCF